MPGMGELIDGAIDEAALRQARHDFGGSFHQITQRRCAGGQARGYVAMPARPVDGRGNVCRRIEIIVKRGGERTFEAGREPAAGAASWAVISHDFWQRRFGGRPDAVGRTISIKAGVLTIIGIAIGIAAIGAAYVWRVRQGPSAMDRVPVTVTVSAA